MNRYSELLFHSLTIRQMTIDPLIVANGAMRNHKNDLSIPLVPIHNQYRTKRPTLHPHLDHAIYRFVISPTLVTTLNAMISHTQKGPRTRPR
jgi:hypothetical protein